jgi:hypothetical protein
MWECSREGCRGVGDANTFNADQRTHCRRCGFIAPWRAAELAREAARRMAERVRGDRRRAARPARPAKAEPARGSAAALAGELETAEVKADFWAGRVRIAVQRMALWNKRVRVLAKRLEQAREAERTTVPVDRRIKLRKEGT